MCRHRCQLLVARACVANATCNCFLSAVWFCLGREWLWGDLCTSERRWPRAQEQRAARHTATANTDIRNALTYSSASKGIFSPYALVRMHALNGWLAARVPLQLARPAARHASRVWLRQSFSHAFGPCHLDKTYSVGGNKMNCEDEPSSNHATKC